MNTFGDTPLIQTHSTLFITHNNTKLRLIIFYNNKILKPSFSLYTSPPPLFFHCEYLLTHFWIQNSLEINSFSKLWIKGASFNVRLDLNVHFPISIHFYYYYYGEYLEIDWDWLESRLSAVLAHFPFHRLHVPLRSFVLPGLPSLFHVTKVTPLFPVYFPLFFSFLSSTWRFDTVI